MSSADEPIGHRKEQHVDIVMNRDVQARNVTTGFEDIRFAHVALPELSLSDIDLSAVFLGRPLTAPLLVSSMTGGTGRTAAINDAISRACGRLGIAFAVGSQRVALEAGGVDGFSRDLRKNAPDVPILANFGAAQLQVWDGVEMARRAVDMIAADGLIIHLNPLQEAVQEGGDTNWSGLLAQIERVARAMPFPIIVKEVGAGISGLIARQLVDAGVAAIDVAGAGGTSWAAVEAERASTSRQHQIAMAFRDWGLPTADAVRQVRASCPDTTLIASGGIRDGIDCAKSIHLGADMSGLAAGLLGPALDGGDSLTERISIIIAQLRIACFCTGSRTPTELRSARLVDRNLG
ncbi:MAG: type 2 isopentenyl-diphosphate Delta-isomerase [Hyphomicrobium sp.]|nr:MAG: type 2 isopentenyl-diphosphate Delta-isomerase [Hyphomicrobium sp.]